jgi:hypothetical protein
MVREVVGCETYDWRAENGPVPLCSVEVRGKTRRDVAYVIEMLGFEEG